MSPPAEVGCSVHWGWWCITLHAGLLGAEEKGSVSHHELQELLLSVVVSSAIRAQKKRVRCGYPHLHKHAYCRFGCAARMQRNMQYAKACADPVRTGGLCWLWRDEHWECAAAEITASEFSTSLLNFRESVLMQIFIWNVFWSWKRLVFVLYLQGYSAAKQGVVPLKQLFPSVYIQALYLKMSALLSVQALWYLCLKSMWLKSSKHVTPWHAAQGGTRGWISPCSLCTAPRSCRGPRCWDLPRHLHCYSWRVS